MEEPNKTRGVNGSLVDFDIKEVTGYATNENDDVAILHYYKKKWKVRG